MAYLKDMERSDVVIEFLRRAAIEELPPQYHVNGDRVVVEIRDVLTRLAKQVILCEDLPAEPLEKFTATAHWSVPSSWWQMFKRDVMPAWFKEKWPVEEREQSKQVEVKMYAVYPRLPYAFPKYGEYKFSYVESAHN
jgi:hypothetical protein